MLEPAPPLPALPPAPPFVVLLPAEPDPEPADPPEVVVAAFVVLGESSDEQADRAMKVPAPSTMLRRNMFFTDFLLREDTTG